MLRRVATSYPSAITWHEVAREAIQSQDIESIRILHNNPSYLPIRWAPLLRDAPADIVTLVTGQAPKVRDIPRDVTARTISLVPDLEFRRRTNSSNYLLYLQYAIDAGATDHMRYILRMYPGIKVESYLGNAHPSSLRALYEDGKIVLTAEEVAILRDEPVLLGDIQVLTQSMLDQVVRFDAVNIYRKYGAQQIVPGITGRIKRYLLQQDLSLESLQQLLARYSADDLRTALESSKRVQIKKYLLALAIRGGYYELLDRYMGDIPIDEVLEYPEATPVPLSVQQYLSWRI